MSTPIGPAQLREQFDAMTVGAFRLETRRAYAMDYERPTFDAFIGGADPALPMNEEWYSWWFGRVRENTAAGRRIERVRLLDDPPTDYQRFNIWIGHGNITAGEDIRYLTRAAAAEGGLPVDSDWWLFDGARVVVMHFDERDALIERELITDLVAVQPYLELRDLAQALAGQKAA